METDNKIAIVPGVCVQSVIIRLLYCHCRDEALHWRKPEGLSGQTPDVLRWKVAVYSGDSL